MEEIKRLKKVYDESADIVKVSTKIDTVSKQIETNRNKANDYHKKLKEHVKANRGGYRDFISLSKQIEFLRKSQEIAFKTFLSWKNKFMSMNRTLKNKLFEAKKIDDEIINKKKKIEEKEKEKEKKIIAEKAKKVEEKFKTTKKLTTEDLIVLGKKDGS